MENTRLYILRIILACIILNAIFVAEAKKKTKHHHHNVSSTTNNAHQTRKNQEAPEIAGHNHNHKHAKKTKRSAYSRSWSSKEYSRMPPYLVFNRKVGAYYPYYINPNDNNIRRSLVRQTSRQG
ncbi:hypothetical protein ABMA27_005992 [Loxostege sticticalis]|uniref:Uncharacterized protein n=1 Tax=Loxostege sticticalis TaxID=481309 RepID=A0ABR3HH73_LOXSC